VSGVSHGARADIQRIIVTPISGVGQQEGDSDLMPHDQDNHKAAGSGISRRDVLKKGAVGAAAGLALPSLLAGTAGAASPAPTRRTQSRRVTSGNPAKVRFWTWYVEQQDQFPQVIAAFQEANPNIEVELRLIADVEGAYLPALLAAAAGDDLPEIYAPHVHSVEFGRQGLAADLKADLGADFIAEFFPSMNNMFVLGDAQYAVGWMGQTMGIYYDPQMFADAGIDGEPETWDEMIEAANLIKSNTSANLGVMQQADNGFSVCDTWLPMITLYSDDPDTLRQLDERDGAKWTDQPVVDALTLYQRTIDEGLWQEGMTGMDDAACRNAMYAGAGAAFYTGSWNVPTFAAEAPPDLAERLKVMKTPTLEAGGRHWTGNSAGAAFSVSEHSPNKDAALTFMQYLYSPDVYTQVMIDSASMPATKAAAEKVTDPMILTMASWLPDGCRHWLVGPAGQIVADTAMELTAGNVDAAGAADAIEATAATLDYGS
jgi:ABC-type glycerol-3-phosphate transport system substrate-binding protein